MLFFPFKADINLSRLPILTILVSLSCLFIYWQQSVSEREFSSYTNEFCVKQDSRIDQVVMKKIADDNGYPVKQACNIVLTSIFLAKNNESKINDISFSVSKFNTKSLENTHSYINAYLNKKSKQFLLNSPSILSAKLYYIPDSFNVIKMITSVFAHGSWMHVIGNLFFFFAFSATIEVILGALIYPVFLVALAIGTNLVYSAAVFTSPGALPTLGLSGVVMGMMGLFTYFIPKAKIRCFFWVIIFVRRFGLPAWLLAMWYFGWDLIGLYSSGTASGVNLVAHVSGFALGFIIGVLLFKQRRAEVHSAIGSSTQSAVLSKAMNS